MPFSQITRDAANDLQVKAATDSGDAVIIAAGPGTGKTKVIERRVHHLLEAGVEPKSIRAVSFTRAATRDLGSRIRKYCTNNGLTGGDDIRVSTLHSMALAALKSAGRVRFAVDPQILNRTETEQIYDPEFRLKSGISSIRRIRYIRAAREAYWATNQNNPANYHPPNPPISSTERVKFNAFHNSRSQLYACLLPGEMVKLAVDSVEAGTLDLSDALAVNHLIVDEYQDLNSVDIRFVQMFHESGASVFVAGDDDQSLYSFRYAFPQGIIDFSSDYSNSSSHVLKHCFRCSEEILRTARTLISAHSLPGQSDKGLISAFADSIPPVSGVVHRWKCSSAQQEAKLIAESCAELKRAGFSYADITILVVEKSIVGGLRDAFSTAGVPLSASDDEQFVLTKPGQFLVAAARLAINPDDYFGYRVVLHHLPRIGIKTATSISDKTISASLNYRAVFTEALPDDVFTRPEIRAIERVSETIKGLMSWSRDALITDVAEEGRSLLTSVFDVITGSDWIEFANSFNTEVTVGNLLDALASPNSAEVNQNLKSLTNSNREEGFQNASNHDEVRMMTIHSAKGLDSEIVFVPALEDQIIPGERRANSAGQILEAARMLYVAITRAKVACFLSFTRRRIIRGSSIKTDASVFIESLGGYFGWRNHSLTATESAAIKSQSNDMFKAKL